MWKILLVIGLLYFCLIHRPAEKGARKKVRSSYSQVSVDFLTQRHLHLIVERLESGNSFCSGAKIILNVHLLLLFLSFFTVLCTWKWLCVGMCLHFLSKNSADCPLMPYRSPLSSVQRIKSLLRLIPWT